MRALLELSPRYARLANNGLQRAHPQFRMVGDRYGDGRIGKPLLHDDMASPLTDFDEPVPRRRMAQTSFPERTRSLPNRNLHPRHVHLLVQTLLNFLG